MKYLIFGLLFFANVVHGESSLTTKQDDFSNGEVTTLRIEAMDIEPAVLFFKCTADKKLTLQLVTNETLFPDSSNDKVMFINTTYKLVSDKEPVTSDWIMSLMKYNMAQYRGDVKEMLRSSLDASGINIRFNKRPTVFKFSFDDAKQHISTLLAKC